MKVYKVKAYTILELVVTMIIAAIVIGITYYAYSIVNKSYLSFNAKNYSMADLVRLDELLRKDFVNGASVIKEQEGITINYKDQIVKYQFTPEAILRIGLRTDTFKVKTEAIITSFEDQPVTEINPVPEQNTLDELAFDLLLQNEKIPYHYYKQYSSEDLVNKAQNAVD